MAAGISEIQSGPFIRESSFHLLGLFLLLFKGAIIYLYAGPSGRAV